MTLRSTDELRALAAGLSASADAFDEALRRATAAGQVEPAQVFECLAQQQSLRAISSELCFESAARALDGLEAAGAELEQGVAEAQAVIGRIATFRNALEVFAGLVVLAAALQTGKVPAVRKAFGELRQATEKYRAEPLRGA